MSMTILVIGLAHGIPVALTGCFTRNRILTLAAAVGMCFVAFAMGGDRYVVVDLIGVGLGAWVGCVAACEIDGIQSVRASTVDDVPNIAAHLRIQDLAKQGLIEHRAQVAEAKKARAAAEQDEAAKLKFRLEQAEPFIHGLFDLWVAEGKVTPCREGSDNLFYQWELARKVAYSIIKKSIYSGDLMAVQDDWIRLMKINLGDALLDAINKAAAAGFYSPAEVAELKQSMKMEYLAFLER